MYLGPKVKDDLRSEEGRRLSRLTKFRIIEEKLKVGVSIGSSVVTARSGNHLATEPDHFWTELSCVSGSRLGSCHIGPGAA